MKQLFWIVKKPKKHTKWDQWLCRRHFEAASRRHTPVVNCSIENHVHSVILSNSFFTIDVTFRKLLLYKRDFLKKIFLIVSPSTYLQYNKNVARADSRVKCGLWNYKPWVFYKFIWLLVDNTTYIHVNTLQYENMSEINKFLTFVRIVVLINILHDMKE